MGDHGPRGVPDGERVPPALSPQAGDRVEVVAPGARRRVLLEIVGLWLAVLLGIRAVVVLQRSLGLHEAFLALVPFLFIYGPVLLCRVRGVDSFRYRLHLPAFRDLATWRQALSLNARILILGFGPWLLAYHVYQVTLFGYQPGWRDLSGLPGIVAYHLFFVALPEEFFYRGYLQTRLNEVFPRKFMVAGVPFGHGLWIACLFFAFGHSLVEFQWWHFATFFPGIAFGLLRERTDGVVAGAFLHAACNVIVHVQDRLYGII